MPSEVTNSENLISALNKHNIKIFGDIEKFVETYSAAQSVNKHKVNDRTTTSDNNEEYIEELIKICNLNDRYKSDANDEEEEVVEEEITIEGEEEKVKQNKLVEEEVIEERSNFDTSSQNRTINSCNNLSRPSSKAQGSADSNNSDTSATRSKSKLNYFNCSRNSNEENNEIPSNSKTSQALSALLRMVHKFYRLFTPSSSFNSENSNDTTTTFVNKNFVETDESVQENMGTSSIGSSEMTTQTPKQRDYYIESLEQILYDPFTSIIHKSYCLKHGRRGQVKNKYPKIGKDSCYEKAANIGNAIKKFEILIREDQKQEFRFKSETMRRTALFHELNKRGEDS